MSKPIAYRTRIFPQKKKRQQDEERIHSSSTARLSICPSAQCSHANIHDKLVHLHYDPAKNMISCLKSLICAFRMIDSELLFFVRASKKVKVVF